MVYEKGTMTYVISLIRRLNRELQLKPRLSTTNTIFIHQPFRHFSSILENFINSYQFRDHEGNVISDESITKFIKRSQQEAQQQEEKEEDEEEEEQQQQMKKLRSSNFYRAPIKKAEEEEEESNQITWKQFISINKPN